MLNHDDFDDDAPEFDLHTRAMIAATRLRGSRWPMVLGIVAVGGMVAAMVLLPGSHHGSLLGALTRGHHDGLLDVTSPVYGFSTVEVQLANEGDLTVDGKSVGSVRHQDLQLAPGNHVLIAHQGARVLTERLNMPANESLRVEFQNTKVRVFREVTATP